MPRISSWVLGLAVSDEVRAATSKRWRVAYPPLGRGAGDEAVCHRVLGTLPHLRDADPAGIARPRAVECLAIGPEPITPQYSLITPLDYMPTRHIESDSLLADGLARHCKQVLPHARWLPSGKRSRGRGVVSRWRVVCSPCRVAYLRCTVVCSGCRVVCSGCRVVTRIAGESACRCLGLALDTGEWPWSGARSESRPGADRSSSGGAPCQARHEARLP